MRTLVKRLHVACVREKGHLLIAGGYAVQPLFHSSTLMAAVYGVVALMGTHLIYRHRAEESTELRHRPGRRRETAAAS